MTWKLSCLFGVSDPGLRSGGLVARDTDLHLIENHYPQNFVSLGPSMSTDDVTTKIKHLQEAAQRVRSAQTASKKHEALMVFDHCLDIDYAFPTYGKDHISAWTGVCTSRLWEVFIDLLTVPVPDLRNMPPFEAVSHCSK